MEVPVYYFFYGNFSDVEFFASWSYVRVMEEGPEECLFDQTEAPDCERDIIQLIHGTEAEKKINVSD